ncbi:MAG: hydrogenase maturation protease, partial [Planctomycetota bacterium]
MSESEQHGHAAQNGGGGGGIAAVEHLVEHLAQFVCPSMAIVCVGNEMCGDDAAGVLVARELAGTVPWAVYDTQTVPESFLMKIVAAKPESVVVIDALDFGGGEGTVEILPADSVAGQG